LTRLLDVRTSTPARASLALAVTLAVACVAGCSGKSGAPFGLGQTGTAVGYVDIDKVVNAHPLHGQLKALEDQIAGLDAQSASQPQGVTPVQQQAQAALERDLQAAAARFEQDLNSRRAYYQQQAQAAMAQIQASALGVTPQPGGVLGGMQQQFGDQMKQLQTSGAKTLEAYRASLFKEDSDHLNGVQRLLAADVRSKIRSKASQLASSETAYQVQLAQQDQDQRLNLKTQLENLSLTPQQRSQYAAQLQDIETREEFLTNQLKTKDDATLTAYETSLQKDAASRFATERTVTEKRTQAKLVARQDEMNQQFHAQAQVLGGRFTQQLADVNKALSTNPKVQQQFQNVQNQTEAAYEADAAQAMVSYRQTRKSLVDKYSAIAHMQFQDQEAIQGEIDGIAAQRRDLYQKILDQVQDQVRTVAQARGVGIVFDSVAGAGSAIDLTDQVAKAVAALTAVSPSPTTSGG
jgi:Skp family chaperone for outer membrane proteins